jgi:phosphoribosylformylglycinamidine (FGAM) synthase-like enzyme
MTAYEMMLSESQERMLMVLEPEKEEVAKAIFVKWGLDFAIVGKTTDDLRFRCVHQGEEVANLPIKDLGDQAPEYDRPWREPTSARRCPQTSSPHPPITARRCSSSSARRTSPAAAGSTNSMTR